MSATPVLRGALALARREALELLVIMLVTAAVYWPGLHGYYLFDDFPNIVSNSDVHVSSTNWNDWAGAAAGSASPGSPRPLAMLSFAANYFFTKLDPFPMKLVNLVIHLINGALLWLVLRTLLPLWNNRRVVPLSDTTIRRLAVGVAAAWLLCPINLSSVLYIVQRMESLAQAFVLLGLWLYLLGRRRMLTGKKNGLALCFAALGGCAAVGLLAKESAVLLPLYAFLIEIAVLRFSADSTGQRNRLWALFAIELFIPAALCTYWLIRHFAIPSAYTGRPFSLEERLLTECRVLVDYLEWTLLPRPDSLGFYHDDIAISHSWLEPATTLLSAAFLGALLAAATSVRHRLPLAFLGILWFFAAHLLTATIIPLELVFEHRNYFSSAGLFLAAGALMLEIPPRYRFLRSALPVLALAALGSTTLLRSSEWGNPIRFAYTEAAQHPNSARASYELGHALMIASGYKEESGLIEPSLAALKAASVLPGTSAAPLAGLIIVASHTHRQIDPEWWSALTELLGQRPVSADDIGALQSLSSCQRQAECPPQIQELLGAFLAALDHPNPPSILLATYGAFCANGLQDFAMAESVLRTALTQQPDSIGFRVDLATVQYLKGDVESARATMVPLSSARVSRQEAAKIADTRHLLESGSVTQTRLPQVDATPDRGSPAVIGPPL